MTVDIARMDRGAALALNTANDALDRLGQWVEAARNAHSLVAPLIGTPFVPDAYKPKVDPRATDEQKRAAYEQAVANATAAVLQGITLGIDPLMALQQIYIIHGRPGMYAKMMVALVQAHGHEVWTEDIGDSRAVVCGRRKGSEHIERVTITMDMARKAKWTSNAKYSETPQDMLWARAAGRVCDRIASDVLKGIASVEQIQDEIQVTAEVGPAQRTVRPRQRAAAAAIEAAVEEPPLDDEPAAEAPAVDETPAPATGATMISPAQSKMLHALLNKAGKGDRADGLKYISEVLDRTVESTKDLTMRDAGQVIDSLTAEPDEPTLDGDWPPAAEVEP